MKIKSKLFIRSIGLVRLFMFVFYLLLISLFASCVKEYAPHQTKYQDLLVIDALFHEGPGAGIVRISKSLPVKEFTKPVWIKGCQVMIKDDAGNVEYLKESPNGFYYTDTLNGISGVPGRKYQLIVSTPAGEVIESTEELMRKDAGIAELRAEYSSGYDNNKYRPYNGYQFYISTNEQLQDSTYYLWQLERTFKFSMSSDIVAYYDGVSLHNFYPIDSLKVCFKTEAIKKLLVYDPTTLNEKSVKNFPFYFEDNNSEVLTMRYCLKVSQYTVSKKTYQYWSNIKKMIEAQGEIYTQQPYQVENNLRYRNADGKKVLGYFTVGGKSEERIFVDKIVEPFFYDWGCGKSIPVYPPPLWPTLLKTKPSDWPIYLYTLSGEAVWYPKSCIDCRARNGFLEKPAYWKD